MTFLKTSYFIFAILLGSQLFMIKTGFYEIVVRKESERRNERLEEIKRKEKRLSELGIKISVDTDI